MPKFTDVFQDTGGLSYVKENEKLALIADATQVPVVRVIYQPTGKYKSKENPDGARFVVIVELDGEERALSFAENSVESRDRMLHELKLYQERDDAEPVTVYLEKVGQSVLIRLVED